MSDESSSRGVRMEGIDEHATYRIGNAIAVTHRLDDGTWIVTFPGFIAAGAAESDALVNLAAEVEGASKRLRFKAIEVSSLEAEPKNVILRTYTTPQGDVCGQIICEATGEILHESGWCLDRTDARRDAEQIAQRKGYRVVESLRWSRGLASKR